MQRAAVAAAAVAAYLLFLGGYPLWLLHDNVVHCELRFHPGLNELTLELPDDLHSLLLTTHDLPLHSIILSGKALNGSISAKGKCRILLNYSAANSADIPV